MLNPVSAPGGIGQNRWWIYQKERFPIAKYGLLIAIFSGSAICYSALLHEPVVSLSTDHLVQWLVAFITVFCCFLQIRIADEFKDFEDDARYRPERPVPRGLVSLSELATVGVLSAVLQAGLALWLMPPLLLLLGMIWGYFGLMCVEFFARNWLKAHISIYMLSHMVILPLIALYATACEWWVQSEAFSLALVPLMATCFFNGIVFEIGRKIRAPGDEIMGVQTYSSLWQPVRAIAIWLFVMACTAVAAGITAHQIHFAIPVLIMVTALWAGAIACSVRFLQHPSSQSAEWIERMAGIWTLGLYFSLGLFPFLAQG